MDSEELVIRQNNQATTTSLKVAEVFEKKHQHILEAIRSLIKSTPTEVSTHLFELSTYFDKQGKSRPMYYMNRDGYTLLVMGFEGKKALKFKLAYMEAFNKMEAIIKSEVQNAITPARPASSLDILQGMLDSLKEQNVKLSAHDTRVASIEQKVEQIEVKKEEAMERLAITPFLSKEFAPEMNARQCSRKLVTEYSEATGISYEDVWHQVYNTLAQTYGIRLGAYKKLPNEKTKLDVAERIGEMQHIHAIISTMVYKLKNK